MRLLPTWLKRISRPWTGWHSAAATALIAVAWLVSLTAAQSGAEGLKRLALPIVAVMALAFLVFDIYERHREPKFMMFQVPFFLGPTFSLICGDQIKGTALPNIMVLIAGMAVFYGLCWIAIPKVRATSYWDDELSGFWRVVFSLACLLSGWIALSIFWGTRYPPLPIDPDRFEKPVRDTLPHSRLPNLRIGLSLSGGGYRAATFHAGSMRALETLGVRPEIMSSVSGGSIFAVYYANGGDPAEFMKALVQGRFSLRRRLLLLPTAARLGFPYKLPYVKTELFPWHRFDRRDAQAELIQSVLLDHADLKRPRTLHQPILALATSDLSRGSVFGKVPNGYLEVDTTGKIRFFPSWQLELQPQPTAAQWVAISGAFPVVIPPATLHARLDVHTTKGPTDGMYRYVTFDAVLVDGGVIDNRGELLLAAANERLCEISSPPTSRCSTPISGVDLTLASDAGAVFDTAEHLEGLAALDRAFNVGTIRARKASVRADVSFSVQDFVRDKSFDAEWMDIDRHLPGVNQRWTRHIDEYPHDVVMAMLRLSEVRGDLLKDRSDHCGAKVPIIALDKCVYTKDERIQIVRIILMMLSADIKAFRTFSTLNDQPTGEQVARMYRLGQLLVYLKWPELEKAGKAAKSPNGGPARQAATPDPDTSVPESERTLGDILFGDVTR